jgi:hypothetical protein
MKIETSIQLPEPKEAKSKYPYLGKHNNDDLIVGFYEPDSGVVIMSGSSRRRPLENRTNWSETLFTPLPSGTIITMEVK